MQAKIDTLMEVRMKIFELLQGLELLDIRADGLGIILAAVEDEILLLDTIQHEADKEADEYAGSSNF